jgi:hypothetical protein
MVSTRKHVSLQQWHCGGIARSLLLFDVVMHICDLVGGRVSEEARSCHN